MMTENPKEIAQLIKALSTEKRVEIIQLLKQGPCCVGVIAKRLGISEPATSQHLHLLKSLGLVEDRRRGFYTHYCLCPDKLNELSDKVVIVCTCDETCACLENEENEGVRGRKGE